MDGREGSGGFGKGLAVGFVSALIVAVCAGGPLGYALVRKKQADMRNGWNLVPVVVAAVEIPAGTVVTFDMVSQRSIPEQFVTSSVIKPDGAGGFINQRVVVDVMAGDPLRHSDFEQVRCPDSP